MADRVLTLRTTSLLSKWGFSDGDEPDDLIDYLEQHGVDYLTLKWHPVLIRLVRERLLPLLDQRVQLAEVETNHNPIRALAVDGRDVVHLWSHQGNATLPALTPESVEVPFSDVLAIIREEQQP